jgi:hypothetical protein
VPVTGASARASPPHELAGALADWLLTCAIPRASQLSSARTLRSALMAGTAPIPRCVPANPIAAMATANTQIFRTCRSWGWQALAHRLSS